MINDKNIVLNLEAFENDDDYKQMLKNLHSDCDYLHFGWWPMPTFKENGAKVFLYDWRYNCFHGSFTVGAVNDIPFRMELGRPVRREVHIKDFRLYDWEEYDQANKIFHPIRYTWPTPPNVYSDEHYNKYVWRLNNGWGLEHRWLDPKRVPRGQFHEFMWRYLNNVEASYLRNWESKAELLIHIP